MPKRTILALVSLVFFLGALYWVNEERISALEEQGRLLEELSTTQQQLFDIKKEVLGLQEELLGEKQKVILLLKQNLAENDSVLLQLRKELAMAKGKK